MTLGNLVYIQSNFFDAQEHPGAEIGEFADTADKDVGAITRNLLTICCLTVSFEKIC
jgi:hypothetical protein